MLEDRRGPGTPPDAQTDLEVLEGDLNAQHGIIPEHEEIGHGENHEDIVRYASADFPDDLLLSGQAARQVSCR